MNKVKRTKIIIFIMIFALWSSGYFASASGEIEMSMNDFIETACGDDIEFEIILVDQLDLAYQKSLALPAGDLLLDVKSEYGLFMKEQKEEPGYDVSLSKLFPYTGTEISGGYAAAAGNGTGSVSAEYSMKVSQSVARDAFGYDTRLLDKITGLEIDVARYQIIEAYETYLEYIIQIYYDWYESFENLRTAENSYKENMKLLENVQKREKENIALPVDVNKVRIQAMAKKENLIARRSEHEQNTNLLKKSLGFGPDIDVMPAGADRFENINIDFEKDYDAFRRDSRTAKILESLDKKSSLEIDRSANKLLPSIDLYGEFVVEASDRYMEKDDKKVLGGISIEYPLPGQVERAEYQTSKISRKRRLLTNANTYDSIRVRLRNIDEDIKMEKELLKIAEEKIKVAKAIVDDDTVNYSYGKINLNNFIDEVNQLDLARFNKIQHSIRLKKLIIEWLALTDRLVTKNIGELRSKKSDS